MHLWSIMAAAALLVVIASAQAPARNQNQVVFPTPGAPLSVETVEERITKNPDGTSTTEVEKATVYRDADGRMRVQMPDDFGPGPMVQLVDPVEGFMAILETSKKIAHRVKIPKTGSSAKVYVGSPGKALTDVPGEKTWKSEDLGKKIFESIEFEGHRATITSVDQPSLVSVNEYWWSLELGLVGSQKYSAPDVEMTARIQHLDRTPPDPALFVIPPDYRIRILEFPNPVP